MVLRTHHAYLTLPSYYTPVRTLLHHTSFYLLPVATPNSQLYALYNHCTTHHHIAVVCDFVWFYTGSAGTTPWFYCTHLVCLVAALPHTATHYYTLHCSWFSYAFQPWLVLIAQPAFFPAFLGSPLTFLLQPAPPPPPSQPGLPFPCLCMPSLPLPMATPAFQPSNPSLAY